MDSTRTMIREHRRCPEYADIFPMDQVDETGQFGNRTLRGPLRFDGLDRIDPERQTRVSATARITGRNGLVTTGWSRTHATRLAHS